MVSPNFSSDPKSTYTTSKCQHNFCSLNTMPIESRCFLSSPTLLTVAALNAIETEGLQAPSRQQLAQIIEAAHRACQLLSAAAILPPGQSEVLEFFADFVIRCVNRPAGVGDAAAH